MRFYASTLKIKLNKGKYTKALKDYIYRAFAKAGAEFMNQAAPNIPVDSGMARGTFLNMLAFFGKRHIPTQVSIPRTAQRTQKNGRPLQYTHHNGRKMPKTPMTGASLSTKPDRILIWQGEKIKFQYDAPVVHLTLNDQLLTRVPGTPWRAFNRGRDAFMRSLISIKRDQPKLMDFVTTTTISGGRGAKYTMRERKQQTSG